MKVYIVFGDVPRSDGDNIQGIFKTKQEAEEYMKKLEEMYSAQKESNDEAREDLRKSRVFNGWMMVIAIIAMLAAIAGPIATILVSR